ncbi:MAG TPA: fatty acid--CoA ligase family protein, partial [Jatrophihabitantaceae bacterium]|nr:fatty acid--CoA ligase family protein [Jatrophihabitantaceae bacterium]
AATERPEEIALGSRAGGLTFAAVARAARGGATIVRDRGARSVVYIGLNGESFAVALFAAAAAGVPVVPLNYRLGDDQLRDLLQDLPAPVIIADDPHVARLDGARTTIPSADWVSAALDVDAPEEVEPVAPDAPAVILFTSGTTSKPKGVVLTHQQLGSYVVQTVEFASAGPTDVGLTCLPNYHIAGVANLLTSTYAGRRIAYLADFSAAEWLHMVRAERVTSATVVPTMLARIVDALGGAPAAVPTLRSLAYGGAPMPAATIAAALRAFPDTGFVNAYGLTETSSTIAVLGPDDHRAAVASGFGAASIRLRSVGRPIPGVEAQIRDAEDRPAAVGEPGRLWVRGPQISGHYLGSGSALDPEGWFDTRDEGWFDGDGYLYIRGRADDTIIRGSENIAPAEIEFVLDSFPGARDAVVVGIPDEEWGERIVAVMVLDDGVVADAAAVRDHVRSRLRSSRTPDEVVFRKALPYGSTGKLLRNAVRQDVLGAHIQV